MMICRRKLDVDGGLGQWRPGPLPTFVDKKVVEDKTEA
jgi:hypothetical protein